MIAIREILDIDEKSNICNYVLRALPSWFAVESSIIDYTKQVQQMPFYAAFDDSEAIGFVALKIHNPFTHEICVMGILSEYHRRGIGKILIWRCEKYCKENSVDFLTVKTLDESIEDDNYRKTRSFYQAMGFKPLEVFPLYWDKDNPCLFMAKSLKP